MALILAREEKNVHLLKANDVNDVNLKGFLLTTILFDHGWFLRINSVDDKYLSFSFCLISLRVVMVAAAELAVVLRSLWGRETGLSCSEVGGELR